MKIALLAPPFQPIPPRTEGGTERIISYLCSGFRKAGHDVVLFAPSDSTQEVETISAGPSVLSLEKAPPSLPSALEAVSLSQLAARASQFDIIHAHTEFHHHAALRPWQDKLVTTLHWRTDERDRQTVYRHFHEAHLIAISHNQASQLEGGKKTVIHHGLPRLKYRARTDTSAQEGPLQLAFIGRLTDQKRPDRAIEIAKRTGRPLKIAGAVDVGNPQYAQDLVLPHLSEKIEWLGAIDDAQKEALLQHSAALLFPIDWEEPFGLVMIEAMACGCPVIAWRKGSAPEIIEDGVTGYLVDSVEEAVAAVAKLPQLNSERIRAEFEKKFTAEKMVADHLALFTQLAGL